MSDTGFIFIVTFSLVVVFSIASALLFPMWTVGVSLILGGGVRCFLRHEVEMNSIMRKPNKIAKAKMLSFYCEGCKTEKKNRWATSPNMTKNWFCSNKHFIKFLFYYIFKQPEWKVFR